ncbi:polyprotein [Fleabane torradovirus]|uniref:Polyprotein n=1 Tax=Fleabane torradovirus TaxID=2963535 RepID=A0AAE9MR14_9SECO|nr:polyprotein [Fleabane torradovirus]
MISSSRGRETAQSINSASVQEITQKIQNFYEVVAESKQNCRRNGMGSFTLVRAENGAPVCADLLDRTDQKKIFQAWNPIRLLKTRKKDTGYQYFHLHGVLFIMVPHVSSRDAGSITIELMSYNDLTDPIKTVTMKLSDGPAVAIMAPTFCLPLTENDPMFFYRTTCVNSGANYPCSVLALWDQSINHRVASYKDTEVAKWALERLGHPQLFGTPTDAARLISTVYGTNGDDSNADTRTLLGFQPYLDTMKVHALSSKGGTSTKTIPRSLSNPKYGSMRYSDSFSIFDEDSDTSKNSAHLEAQSVVDYEANVLLNCRNGFYGNLPCFKKSTLLGTIRLTTTYMQEKNTFGELFGHKELPIGPDGEFYMAKHGCMSLTDRYVHLQASGSILFKEFDAITPYELCEKARKQRHLYWLQCGKGSPFAIAATIETKYAVILRGKHPVSSFHPDRFTISDNAVRMQTAKEKFSKFQAKCNTFFCKLWSVLSLWFIYFGQLIESSDQFFKEQTVFARTKFDEVMQNHHLEREVILVAQADPIEEETSINSEEAVVANSLLGNASENETSTISAVLAASPNLFNFDDVRTSVVYKELDLQQPAVVTSQEFLEAGCFDFKWKSADPMCKQLCTIPLPASLLDDQSTAPLIFSILRYFDAATIRFQARIAVSSSFAVTGQLVLLWDEGDVLATREKKMNQATLLTTSYVKVGATATSEAILDFTPLGIGKFVPLDKGIGVGSLGSLRVYVLFPIISGDPTLEFAGHVHLRAKILSTNIMQPQRMIAQFQGGVDIGEASMAEIVCSQTLITTEWKTNATPGDAVMVTFSPASVFEQDGILQPTILCNLFRNCKWWTGECEFEIHIDKSAFHSGCLGVGFGSLAADLKRKHDIYNTPHVLINLDEGDAFKFSIKLHSWNGVNLLSAGRKSSLPKMEHRALLRIFLSVVRPLMSTNKDLTSIHVVLMLKRIKNLVVGGSTPIKPVFGHWHNGSSGTDYFFSEASGADRKLLAELLKQNLPKGVRPRALQAQAMSIRNKLSKPIKQYIIKKLDNKKRYVVLPVAPWSFNFPLEGDIIASDVCSYIDLCSAFLYWAGDIQYTIVIHRKQATPNVGGVFQVVFDSSGYPVSPGFQEGNQPLATGGGTCWYFPYSSAALIHSFTVKDDNFFQRRYSHYCAFQKENSRINTLADRLGNLIIYMPSEDSVAQVEVYISLGTNFRFSTVKPPMASIEKEIGDMESHVYLLDEDNRFKPREGVTNSLAD